MIKEKKQKFKEVLKIFIRSIAAIFIIGMLIITHAVFIIKRVRLFILYGGEFIIHENKDERITIKHIYEKLKTEYND
jgi:ABC-type microcin C transport system duplicated ATPase subunit YejF